MPTYGYRCENGHEFEVFQSMTDAPLDQCEVCAAPVRRIFYPVGIVFKGPGFYKTDSRGSSSSTNPAPAAPSGTSDTSSTESSSSDKPDTGSKPAKKSDKKTVTKTESKPSSGSAEKKSA